MKSRIDWDTARIVKLTRFAALTVSVAFGLSATAICGFAYFAHTRAVSEEARSKALEHQAKEIGGVLEQARSRLAVDVRNQSKAVADFQENVSILAKSTGVTVSEFLASTEFQPYLSRFEKNSDGAGWSQVEIQLMVAGETRQVLESIGKLGRQSVPLEFNSVQITRDKATATETRVKAKILLRILVKTPGGQA